METAFEFPGEKYLLEELPDYAGERQMLVAKLLMAFFVWIFLVPSFLATEAAPEPSESGGGAKTVSTTTTTTTTTGTGGTLRRRTTTTTRIVKAAQKTTKTTTTKTARKKPAGGDAGVDTKSASHGPRGNPKGTTRSIEGKTNAACFACCLLHLSYILVRSSPDNYYTSRTIFETPLFTRSECDHLVEMAERVAGENYERAKAYASRTSSGDGNANGNGSGHQKAMGYLEEPRGWQKLRHAVHPTTDLNLSGDGFSDADREWLGTRLDARLAPTLERIFGIPPGAVRANDMFVVRYDGDRQASLSRHTDSGSITFSVLLSDGFEGGGTRYWNRLKPNQNGDALGSPFAYLLPEVGMMQTFPAMIQHEGVPTTRGRRYLLIGFLAVDKIDPWTHTPTGLSWFSSWGSLNWASTKFKEGKNSAWRAQNDGSNGNNNNDSLLHSTQAGMLFELAHSFFLSMCDVVFRHRFAVLVDSSSAEDFLRDLDDAHAKKAASSENQPKSSWFEGQQIDVNFDGTFSGNWNTKETTDAEF